jgi:NADPH-dependent 2,4-dienoyl-CoA reductase/sulfur reductase-like enzyme
MGLLGASALGQMLPLHAFGKGGDDKKRGKRDKSEEPATVPGPTGASGKVVVVGGGMAGATAAKFLRLWGGSDVEVTLVERNLDYPSSILSNLVLIGSTTMNEITFNYNALKQNYGVNVVLGEVVSIDKEGKMIMVGNTPLSYDRLVLAPGIEFDYSGLPGLEDPASRPLHAWVGGPQTTALRGQILGMPDGGAGTFIITIPKLPYRCPPGPYDRACVIAEWLKRNRGGGKVIVLDANPGITADAENFSAAFAGIYAGIIEYHSGVVITNVDPVERTVTTFAHGTFPRAGSANVLNVIPPHRAAKLVTDAGLVNATGRAPIDVLSYASTMAPDIHVIGDSALSPPQPMAGHIANQEAKVCADAIVRLLSGNLVDPAPVTNSACYSLITGKTASWLSVGFRYNPLSGTMEAVPESSAGARTPSGDNYEEMFKWFGNLMSDSFG